MIGRLRGTVAEITEDEALIDVGGVGYLVRCGARCLSRLPAIGQDTVLHIESQTTEAAGTRLYGFLDRSERSVFSLLQSVQGVGPKLALRIVTELKGKPIGDGLVQGLSAHDPVPVKLKPSVSGEAVAALMGLGLAEPAARRAVEQAVDALGVDADISAVIKAALKEMGR